MSLHRSWQRLVVDSAAPVPAQPAPRSGLAVPAVSALPAVPATKSAPAAAPAGSAQPPVAFGVQRPLLGGQGRVASFECLLAQVLSQRLAERGDKAAQASQATD